MAYIHALFVIYTVLLFVRVFSSWLPHHLQHHRIFHFVSFYTDPYLNLFRRILPPLGGVLDLSPILAFFALKLLELLVVWALTW